MTVKSNGFQDRLVMTASIPLRVFNFSLVPYDYYIIARLFKKVNTFWRQKTGIFFFDFCIICTAECVEYEKIANLQIFSENNLYRITFLV